MLILLGLIFGLTLGLCIGTNLGYIHKESCDKRLIDSHTYMSNLDTARIPNDNKYALVIQLADAQVDTYSHSDLMNFTFDRLVDEYYNNFTELELLEMTKESHLINNTKSDTLTK